jgi:hypothetical protein
MGIAEYEYEFSYFIVICAEKIDVSSGSIKFLNSKEQDASTAIN